MRSRAYGGAGSALHYDADDVAAIVAYAKDRGVREFFSLAKPPSLTAFPSLSLLWQLSSAGVVPEIDTPGHSESWHVGYPDVTVYSVNEYMLDPTKNETFGLLEGLFGEIADMFEDEYIHIGCDEVSFAGLNSSASIVRYMEANGLTRHGTSSVQN